MPFGIERFYDFVEHQSTGLVVALALFVLDHAALIIELALRDRAQQVAHTVAFQPQRPFQRAARHGLKIIGPVEIGRAVVIGRAHFLQILEVIVRCVLAAVEHQMFEQMGEAGLPLRLVLAADIVPHGHADDRGLAIGVDDDVEAVVEHELFVWDIDFIDQG